MKTYVINMAKDVDKRRKMELQMSHQSGLDYEFFNAIEGRKLTDEDIARLCDFEDFKRRYGDVATLPALGCSLSHVGIYKRMIEAEENVALVLEDDALLSENINLQIKPLLPILGGDAPVAILLTPEFLYDVNDCRESLGEYKLYELKSGFMTSGYLVNIKGARLLLDLQSPVRYFADAWDVYVSRGLKLFGIIPHIVSYPDGLGEIGLSQYSAIKRSFFRRLRSLAGRIKSKLEERLRERKGIYRAAKLW